MSEGVWLVPSDHAVELLVSPKLVDFQLAFQFFLLFDLLLRNSEVSFQVDKVIRL